jgi:hypothetical protein
MTWECNNDNYDGNDEDWCDDNNHKKGARIEDIGYSVAKTTAGKSVSDFVCQSISTKAKLIKNDVPLSKTPRLSAKKECDIFCQK